MSVYVVRVGMNRPTVHAPESVQGILEQYDVRPELQVVTGDKAGTGVLAFKENKPDWVDWPSAVRGDELPYLEDEAVYKDEDDEQRAWNEAYELLHEERGQEGLTNLLLELAPYLGSPLVIQAATWGSYGDFSKAREWTVQPGAKEIEVKEIVGMDDEHSIVEMS
jgi:hypothetical protein